MKVIYLDRDPKFSSRLAEDFKVAEIEVVSAITPAEADRAFDFECRKMKGSYQVRFVVAGVESAQDSNLHFLFALAHQSDWPRHRILMLSNDPDLSAIALEWQFHFLQRKEANLAQRIFHILQEPERPIVSAPPERLAEHLRMMATDRPVTAFA